MYYTTPLWRAQQIGKMDLRRLNSGQWLIWSGGGGLVLPGRGGAAPVSNLLLNLAQVTSTWLVCFVKIH